MPIVPSVFGSPKPTVGKASASDLSQNPIYKCSSIPESRAKTLCRKHPGRMLDLTETQVRARTEILGFGKIRNPSGVIH